MFRKVAQVTSLGSFGFDAEAGGFRFVASAAVADEALRGDGALHERAARSYFADGARKLDVRELIGRVADAYAISERPEDFFFEAIRANTTNAPNENNDGFHQAELLRHDVRLGMPVYRTYSGKPHLVNHRSQFPKEARGLIIDAHYNDDAPALPVCPSCSARTAERKNRDETGLHCKCGTLVKDEFVEILVGIDTTKDRPFAEGVRNGTLRSGSMGCNCISTRCNVCSHVAYAKPEFCQHIRQGSKGSLWVRKGNQWTKTAAADVGREYKKRGAVFTPRDFCYGRFDDGFEVRKAYEYCYGVVFDEYSRVEQPADPKAQQVEVLNLRAAGVASAHATVDPRLVTATHDTDGRPSPEFLAAETEALIRGATASTEQRAAARLSAQVVPGAVPQSPGLPQQQQRQHVRPRIMAPSSGVPAGARPGDGMDQQGVGIQLEEGDEPLTVIPPGAVPGTGAPGQGPSIPGGEPVPGAPPMGPSDIEQYTDDQTAPPEQPQRPRPDEELSMGEMGVLPVPPGASAPSHRTSRVKPSFARSEREARSEEQSMRFRAAYSGWRARVSEQGNCQVLTGDGTPALIIKADNATQDPHARKDFGREVLASLFADGLVATAKRYNAFIGPRMAQVVAGGLDDMKEFADKQMFGSPLEGGETDLTETRAKPPKDTRTDAADSTDMADAERGKPPASVDADGALDHAKDVMDPAKGVTSQDPTDMRDKRPSLKMKRDTVLSNEVHDHAEPLHRGAAKHCAKHMDSECPEDCEGAEHEENEREGGKAGTTPFPGAAEAFKSPAYRSAGAQPAAAASDADAASADAAQARLVKVFEAKLARVKKEAAEAVEAVKKAAAAERDEAVRGAVEGFVRGLRVVHARYTNNLERAPLKEAMYDAVAEERVVGHDAASGEQLVFKAAPDHELAVNIVESTWNSGAGAHLESMVKRAYELVAMGDEYLLAAERDLRNLTPQIPQITAMRHDPKNEAAQHAGALRREARRGNLRFTPAPADAETGGRPDGRRGQIREAVKGTLADIGRAKLGLN